jgi:glutamate synthase domain-containing protein 2
MRHLFFLSAALALVAIWVISLYWPPFLWAYVLVLPLVILGTHDAFQTKRAVLRNFPVIGHGRYLLELIRPEINQYFIESNTDGTPFNREMRSVVYQRAKGELDTLPFGTQWDVYAPGYEWINHSMLAHHGPTEAPRVVFGEGTCAKPYSSSLLNISAMSYGALSKNAIEALSGGAKRGGFAHNTGEGGLSPYHIAGGGDLIWQLGTGYFGCRDEDGNFDPLLFKEKAAADFVKMIEVKLSQGAKPGHGGILPAAKVTEEIARIRNVPLGQDVLSPPAHTAFSTPIGLLEFVTELRELSGGKPVGFKLCVGSRSEFLGICRAMQETRLHPDFIVVDGGEGGTGAAPLEFSNSIGTPLTEALAFVHNALTGFRLRDKVKVIAAGKIITGFHMARALALGADACYSARGMMMAIGCIQARRCNSNECPVGVATQLPSLVAGLDVENKAERTARYHQETIESLMEILGAAGLSSPSELEPRHIMRRVDPLRVMSYAEIFEFIEPGALLFEPVPEGFEADWRRARSDRFQ